MIKIFAPKNDRQKELVEVIKTHNSKIVRKSAIKALRKEVGDNYPVPAITVEEYYDSIIGKPSYFRRFKGAIIKYDNTKL